MKKLIIGVLLVVAGMAKGAGVMSDAERNNSTQMNAVRDVGAAEGVKGGVRVLILGNSITLHAPAPKIGWTNECGMSASKAENDYAHIVTRGIEAATGRRADLRLYNVVDFERNFATWQPSAAMQKLIDFDAEYLVIAIGENVRELTTEEERRVFRDSLKRFFGLFLHGRAKPRVVVRGVFWPSKWKDDCLAHVASDLAFTFVKADFGRLDEMRALGQYWHSGVAAHPNDLGMAAIANAILEGFFPPQK